MQKTRADTDHINLILNEPEFERVYLDLYDALFRYAFTMLHDNIMAEEIVHLVFLKLLDRNGPIVIHTSLKAYLYRSVNNECLNYIKHQKVKRAFEVKASKTMSTKTETPLVKFQYEELEQQVKEAIGELPEQCRTIFQMSRFEELKYAEIANQLDLSIKTVETQMSRALKKLRIRLADYLPILVWHLLFSLLYLIKY